MAQENVNSNQPYSQKHPLGSYQFQGIWVHPDHIPNIISFQNHFQALDDDIIVASKPKSGTTWLKALVFSNVNRHRYSLSNTHPFNSSNPHELVPYLEMTLYEIKNGVPNLDSIPSPRLFSTHLPYASLVDSIKQSNSRIVYINRDPLDAIVSFWHFVRSAEEHEDLTLEDCFDMFCKGEEPFGSFWDHVLGYWKKSLENTNKVLFLNYEDMRRDEKSQIKRLAEFIGFPFSMEEERGGVNEEIAKFYSLKKLKDLEVNKNGKMPWSMPPNKALFRKGEVGDYVNYLSPQVNRFNQILQEKLVGSNLPLNMSC